MVKSKSLNINKNYIIENINKLIGIPKAYSKKFLSETILIIIENLKEHRILKIKNFGTFKVLKKKGRVGRNPKNKKIYNISARNVVVFKTSNYLKKKLNNE